MSQNGAVSTLATTHPHVTWADLFERAQAYDVEMADVRTQLAERRERDDD